MKFFLGAHLPHWLATAEVPLFVSHLRLQQRVGFPRATAPWALDSGSFSEIALRGRFGSTPAAYVKAVRRYGDQVGRLEWAAPQDHMCEPWVLARSELASTVAEAQTWTVANFLTLRSLAADIRFIPVLQGMTAYDYRVHADQYLTAGIDLTRERLVGLGSVCRRQATDDIAQLVALLSSDGLNLHGFGIKTAGLRRYGWCLTSADSMAWSYRGRRIRPCPHFGLTSCANCLPHALTWRLRAIDDVDHRAVQMSFVFDSPVNE